MTYSPITPQSQPSPAATQAQIQTNFAQYATIFSRNHTAINKKNQGDHEGIVLENQIIDPSVDQDLVAIYAKNANSTSGMQPQLFARILKFLPSSLDTTNASNTPMQMTYNTVNIAGPQYQSFLIGGYLVFFGSTNTIATPITLLPSPSFLFAPIAIPTNIHGSLPNNVATVITQPNIFKINSSSALAGDVFLWLAIGNV